MVRKKTKLSSRYKKLSYEQLEKLNKKGRRLANKKQTKVKFVSVADLIRTALPPGKRISKNGKVYYETRANRSDVLAGYDKPYLRKKKKTTTKAKPKGKAVIKKGKLYSGRTKKYIGKAVMKNGKIYSNAPDKIVSSRRYSIDNAPPKLRKILLM